MRRYKKCNAKRYRLERGDEDEDGVKNGDEGRIQERPKNVAHERPGFLLATLKSPFTANLRPDRREPDVVLTDNVDCVGIA